MSLIYRNRRLMMLFLGAAALLTFPNQAAPQEQIREYVRVNQVELTVRVIDQQGKPVSGLTKQDFTLTENGSPVPVTSCIEVQRRIDRAVPATDQKPSAPRLFLVYFWVWQENEAYSQALDTLFKNVYRQGDTVVLSMPTSTRVIQKRSEIETIRGEFERDLQEWTRQRTLNMESIVANLNRLLRDFIENDRLLDTPESDWGFKRAFETLKNSVLNDWRFFRSSFLDVPNRNFKRLAEILHDIKRQKWAIVFLQPSTFPTVHPNALIWTRFDDPNKAQQLREFANDMIRTMNTPHEAETQVNAIEQAFIRGNTTFHLIRMDVKRNETNADPDLVMQEVFSDRQWTFQRLARATGGQIISDNIPKRALNRIADAEDVYYRLTYQPAHRKAERAHDQRRLLITTNRPSTRIYYVRNMRLSEVEEIRLAEFHSDSTRVKFILTGYAVRMEGENLQSDIQVRISAESPRGEVLTFTRNFNTPEPFLQVSMAVRYPRSGHYRLRFHAEDRFTGRVVKESQVIQVILPARSGVKSLPGDKQP